MCAVGARLFCEAATARRGVLESAAGRSWVGNGQERPMDRYLAVIRLKRPVARSMLCARLKGEIGAMRGVDRVETDPSTDAVCVTFDRTRVTLADLVRCLEDGGMSVAGVSQGRETTAAAATA